MTAVRPATEMVAFVDAYTAAYRDLFVVRRERPVPGNVGRAIQMDGEAIDEHKQPYTTVRRTRTTRADAAGDSLGCSAPHADCETIRYRCTLQTCS